MPETDRSLTVAAPNEPQPNQPPPLPSRDRQGAVRRFGYPLLMLLIIIAFFWKITLNRQFDWMWGPDIAHQVLPWFEEEARQMRHLQFPLWDPHTWGGQPMLAQGQPGVVYPLNWLLFLIPPVQGHLSVVALQWYFIAIHYMAALFCYLLCRDLGLSRVASLTGGLIFALAAFVGALAWPQMLNGAVWQPLVFLFLLRAVRGYRPLTSAALCGLFWGMSWLGGHHQLPIFLTLTAGATWLYYVLRQRSWRLAGMAVVSAGFMFLTAAAQTLPAAEYGPLAKRWVSAAEPVGWNQPVPYSVHQQFSISPLTTFGIVFPGIDVHNSAFLGIVALSLIVIAIACGWKRGHVKLFTALLIGGFAYALGFHNVFQGILYAVVPFVEKARTPWTALAIFGFGAAVLAAFGVDELRKIRATNTGRWIAWSITGFGLLTWLVLFCVILAKGFAWMPDGRLGMTALAGLFAGGLLFALYKRKLTERAAAVLLIGLMLIEFGNLTGYDFADLRQQERTGWLNGIRSNVDIEGFLNRQPRPFRVYMDTEELGLNWPEYHNFDQIKSYLASITTNWSVPAFFEPPTQSLFNVRFTIGHETHMPDAKEVYRGASGMKVFDNPHAFPRAWAVHELVTIKKNLDGHVLIGEHLVEMHSKAFAFANESAGLPAGSFKPCAGADQVSILRYRAEDVSIRAQMACDGMVVLSDTFYPGWKAYVDGKRATIHEVNFAMRGVLAPSGTHDIQYRYRPGSFYAGAAMTAAGVLGACCLAFFSRKRRDPIDLSLESRNNQD
jgi:hypothetical protein